MFADKFIRMEITQEVLFISDNPNENQVTKEEAIDIYKEFIKVKYFIKDELKYNFNPIKSYKMAKQLEKILNNCQAINDGVITLSMVRDYQGAKISMFMPNGEFEYKKPFNQILNIDDDQMKELGNEHYTYNTHSTSAKPDYLEFDTEIDPNYVAIGYNYTHASSPISNITDEPNY